MNRVINRVFFAALFLCLLFAPLAGAQQQPKAVSLNTPLVWNMWEDEAPDKKMRNGSPLVVELSRQAVLIAARDELGLRTLDASLGEHVEGPGVEPLALKLDVFWREGSVIELQRGDKQVLQHTVPADYWNRPGIIRSVKLHEAFSREDAPQAMREAGLAGEPNKWHDSAPVPDPIQALVDELSLVSQFRAARALHKLIGDDGESPERLWALTRVYANLGQESRWFIRCQFAAFQARSLLYGQRLAAKAPGHPLGELSLSYAWSMAAYTRTASIHLNNFDKAEHADKAEWQPWAELVRACCNYDRDQLETISNADGPRASVAALWGVITNEFVELDGLTFGAIEHAMQVNPISTRLLYGGYDTMGVSMGHWLTEAAPKHFGLVTTRQLLRIDNAPEAIAQVLDALDGDPMELRELTETGWKLEDLTKQGKDPEEFSFAVLGSLIGEANALHILYRAKFMRSQWGVDTSGYLKAVSPALGRHPYRPLILTFLMPRNTEHEVMRDLMASFEPGYINQVNLSTFVWHMPSDYKFANGMTENDWWRKASSMTCMSGTDWLSGMRWYSGDNIASRGKVAGNMASYDPHNPKRIALRLQYFNLDQEQVNKLVAEYGHHPVVAHALADRMEREGKIEAAREYAELAATAAPERRTIERQARIELLLGHEDRWLKLMESILDLPDHGLDHARINEIVAKTYMNQDRYEEARPYAKAAADSWARWAMLTYTYCLTGLGEFEEAEQVIRRHDQRYAVNDYFHWALWSGHGDRAPLLRQLDADSRKRNQGSPTVHSIAKINARISAGEFEEAFKQVESRWGDADNPITSRELMQGLCLAQQLGLEKKRDAYLERLINFPPVDGKRLRFALLAELCRDALDKGEFDSDKVKAWIKEHDDEYESQWHHFGVWFMAASGDWDQAKPLLLKKSKSVLMDNSAIQWYRAVARSYGATDQEIRPTNFYGAHEWPEREAE